MIVAMNFAASRLAIPPMLDTERFLAQLPPRIRAGVVWAAQPIRVGLAKLRCDEPDHDQLARVSDELLEPLVSLIRAAVEAVREDPGRFERAVGSDLEQERVRLDTFLADEESRDTAEWAFELLDCVFSGGMMLLTEKEPGVDLDFRVEDLRDSHAFVAYVRGTIALMAAVEEARIGVNRVVAADLVDLAFIELSALKEILASEGIELEPFADDDQRMERFARNVEWLRSSLSEAEHQVLTGARLRNFSDAPRH
jgi:hypothetical protein